MSKEKKIEKELHILFKIKSIDSMLYASVRSLLNILPSATVEQAILNFMETFDLSEEDFSLKNAVVIYYRILNEIKKTGLWQK